MVRKIIKIDKSKCNGCGACALACHEGAIEMIDNVATLTREDYCDGLGDCLPACPTGAITFEERDAAQYNEAAVIEAKKKKASAYSPSAYRQTSTRPEHQFPLSSHNGPARSSSYRKTSRTLTGQTC